MWPSRSVIGRPCASARPGTRPAAASKSDISLVFMANLLLAVSGYGCGGSPALASEQGFVVLAQSGRGEAYLARRGGHADGKPGHRHLAARCMGHVHQHVDFLDVAILDDFVDG